VHQALTAGNELHEGTEVLDGSNLRTIELPSLKTICPVIGSGPAAPVSTPICRTLSTAAALRTFSTLRRALGALATIISIAAVCSDGTLATVLNRWRRTLEAVVAAVHTLSTWGALATITAGRTLATLATVIPCRAFAALIPNRALTTVVANRTLHAFASIIPNRTFPAVATIVTDTPFATIVAWCSLAALPTIIANRTLSTLAAIIPDGTFHAVIPNRAFRPFTAVIPHRAIATDITADALGTLTAIVPDRTLDALISGTAIGTFTTRCALRSPLITQGMLNAFVTDRTFGPFSRTFVAQRPLGTIGTPILANGTL